MRFVSLPVMLHRYKFSLLETRLAIAGLMQAYSFTLAPGLPKTRWYSGVVYTPDCLWLHVSRRRAGKAPEPYGVEPVALT